MKVKELIEKLKELPQDVRIVFIAYDGCYECDPECFGSEHNIGNEQFKAEGDYPYADNKNYMRIQ